jgi:hypothetical protein
MNKNFFLTLTALAVMASLGYAAYTNGSIDDLTQTVNNKLASASGNFLAALTSTTQKAGGSKESVSFSISVDPKVKIQNIVAGTVGSTFASYILDAKKSSDDIIVSSLTLTPVISKGVDINDIQNCQLWDSSSYMSGVGTLSAGQDVILNLSNGFTLARGEARTVSIRCNISASGRSLPGASFRWDVKGAVAKGVATGKDAVVKINSSKGPNLTLRSGELRVILDPAVSKAKAISCGSTVPTLGLKFSAKYEDFSVRSLKFKFGGSATAGVIKKFTLYDNMANVLGEGVFSGDGMAYTSTSTNETSVVLNKDFIVPKDQSVSLYVTTELSNGSVCQNAKNKTVAIDYNGITNAVGVTSAGTTSLKNKISAPRNTIK